MFIGSGEGSLYVCLGEEGLGILPLEDGWLASGYL